MLLNIDLIEIFTWPIDIGKPLQLYGINQS